jgi:hypothetical protein
MKTTIVIFFAGLIVHVNQPGVMNFDNTAVLPRSEHHLPVIWVFGEVKGAPPDWIKKDVQEAANSYGVAKDLFPSGGPVHVAALDRVRIRVTGTRGVFSHQEESFQKSVPPLKVLQPSCTLRDEIKKREFYLNDGDKEHDFAAFVDYTGGSRHADAYGYCRTMLAFPDANANHWKTQRCVGCITRYQADLEKNHATLVIDYEVTGKRYTVEVAGGSTIVIGNAPAPGMTGSGHIPFHYSIFKNCDPPRTDVGGACTVSEPPKGKEFLGTLFPNIPNGDCTNSGYP